LQDRTSVFVFGLPSWDPNTAQRINTRHTIGREPFVKVFRSHQTLEEFLLQLREPIKLAIIGGGRETEPALRKLAAIAQHLTLGARVIWSLQRPLSDLETDLINEYFGGVLPPLMPLSVGPGPGPSIMNSQFGRVEARDCQWFEVTRSVRDSLDYWRRWLNTNPTSHAAVLGALVRLHRSWPTVLGHTVEVIAAETKPPMGVAETAAILEQLSTGYGPSRHCTKSSPSGFSPREFAVCSFP
jgi:hypothetical protein